MINSWSYFFKFAVFGMHAELVSIVIIIGVNVT